MSEHIGAPGPGGSMGQCALCGDSFAVEVIAGKPVKSFTVSGGRQTLYGHDRCIAKATESATFDVATLPKESPLRQAFEAAQEKP